MGGVPSVPTDKSRTVQVISAGYSRTGTVSMSLALEKLLDGPVLHGGTQLFQREDAYTKLWVDILTHRNDKPVVMKLLREATAGFVAVADAPCNQFLSELMELYPDAKVIVVNRDPDRWFQSMQTIMKHISPAMSIFMKVFLSPCPTWRWAPTWMALLGRRDREVMNDDSEFTKDRLQVYNDYVRSLTPPDNVLTYELKQGWEPLAKFVGRPIPDEPFPHANDAEAVDEFSKTVFRRAGLIWIGILTCAGTAAWAGWKVWDHRS